VDKGPQLQQPLQPQQTQPSCDDDEAGGCVSLWEDDHNPSFWQNQSFVVRQALLEQDPGTLAVCS
jgi:hypothetical protein